MSTSQVKNFSLMDTIDHKLIENKPDFMKTFTSYEQKVTKFGFKFCARIRIF